MSCRKLMMGLVVSATLSATLAAAVPAPAAPAAPAPAAPAAPPTPPAPADPAASVGWPAGVSTFRGRAFDTCLAPSADTMRRWKSSNYGAVGVYYAGRGRACKRQPNLSRAWMRTVRAQGWKVLPVYVGSQSPCVTAKHKKNVRMGRYPVRQGTQEGRDAVRKARALGMRRLSPLYLDMESYTYRQKWCAHGTLAFVRAWNREVRRFGYVPGFYSSASSGVRHMETARRAGVRDLPSVMWFARWHTRPHLYREPVLRRDAWRPERRIHQYAGNVKERHGGRTLKIDRNLVHAPVARVG
ncbi:DUF1906 domain-containing protein [Streptomyces sp. NPDC055099]